MLKKGAFQWNNQAQQAFETLKQALVTAHVLALPNFDKKFVIETDASKGGIGAVLGQEGQPITFIGKSLGPKWQRLSVYEKELLAVVFAVQKWEQYLMNNHFEIKTDQKSLQWLLQQKVSTPFQQFWLAKLMGFDYDISYNKGKDNVVVDALFRIKGAEILCCALSLISSDLEEKIKRSYVMDPYLVGILQRLTSGEQVKHYTLQNDLLRRKQKLVVGPDVELRTSIITWHHTSMEAGHSGRDATVMRVKRIFFWKHMVRHIRQFVRECKTCQAAKNESVAYPGLSQPLSIPTEVWQDISMDFITGLPKSCGKDVIFVVVDRFSKSAHFMTLSHPFTAIQVAQVYLDNVCKLHGWPRSIVSDRDLVFVSTFWKSLFDIQGTQFCMSSAYHPQSDGQTEVVNRCLEMYLRCMCGEEPKEWAKWIPLAEWWYNTHFHSSTQLTPYEIVYNQPPPLHLPYLPGESSNATVDRSLQRREDMIKRVKLQLHRAQSRMKSQADKHRTDRSFHVGDWVWLKLQPYRQNTIHRRNNQKLAKRYFGPFKITVVVGKVAYQLQLPRGARIHNVVHISQLKAFHGQLPQEQHLPDWLQSINPDEPTAQLPEAIINKRMVKKNNAATVQYLVKWHNCSIEDATWIDATDFASAFPGFNHET